MNNGCYPFGKKPALYPKFHQLADHCKEPRKSWTDNPALVARRRLANRFGIGTRKQLDDVYKDWHVVRVKTTRAEVYYRGEKIGAFWDKTCWLNVVEKIVTFLEVNCDRR